MNDLNLPEPQSKNYFYIYRDNQWIEVFKSEAANAEILVFVERSKGAWFMLGSYGSIGAAKGQITTWKGGNNRKSKVFLRELNGFIFEEVYFGKEYV